MKDKEIKGISKISIGFFSLWNVWTLFFFIKVSEYWWTIGAYIIALGFFNVYEMAVSTVFLCFLEDLERNDGTPEKPYFMSKSLMSLLMWLNMEYGIMFDFTACIMSWRSGRLLKELQ